MEIALTFSNIESMCSNIRHAPKYGVLKGIFYLWLRLERQACDKWRSSWTTQWWSWARPLSPAVPVELPSEQQARQWLYWEASRYERERGCLWNYPEYMKVSKTLGVRKVLDYYPHVFSVQAQPGWKTCGREWGKSCTINCHLKGFPNV